MKYLVACLLAFTIDWTLGARILAVLPMPYKSHHIMSNNILKDLAERGHQVVNYTPFPLGKTIPNYTEVQLEVMETTLDKVTYELVMEFLNMSPVRFGTLLWNNADFLLKYCLANKKIRELIDSNEKFDLVILEPFFGQEGLLGFGHKFNAPVVAIHSFGSFSLLNSAAGNSLALAHIPDFSFPSSDHMSFYERLLSSYSILSTLFSYYTTFLPAQDDFLRAVFKDPTMPPVLDLVHNISLYVNNAHPNVHYAQPYTPNIIPLGGIHLSKERNPLPSGMKKFLDETKHGVIYVSLGSVLPDHLLPQEFFDNFIKAFRRLPQRVLWKTISEHPRLPDNVMTAKWMPQQDILAHPNVILFVTHGGLFGQHEAINAGVPVVCVPFFGDQPMNAKFYAEHQIGAKLPFQSLSEETLHSTITKVLHNPKYKENMKRLSEIYRDRPVSPSDSLAFWVEYVLRHRGAQHLRPASAGLSWYQLALLDVLGVILAALVLLVTLLYLALTRVLRLIRSQLHRGYVPQRSVVCGVHFSYLLGMLHILRDQNTPMERNTY